MPSYSIAMSPTGPIGEAVGGGYSGCTELTDLLRDELGYDGNICADWDITTDKKWGVEHKSRVERHYMAFHAGLNMMGGCNEYGDFQRTPSNMESCRSASSMRTSVPMPPEFLAFAAGRSGESRGCAIS